MENSVSHWNVEFGKGHTFGIREGDSRVRKEKEQQGSTGSRVVWSLMSYNEVLVSDTPPRCRILILSDWVVPV